MALDGGELLELLCPICYGDQGESGYATLVCGHVFHSTCLERSLKVKKECPSCRCPARPLDTGRRDAGPQVKCPCKTGQPVRLYHLQRPRAGGDDFTQPSSGVGGAGGSEDAAALAAAEHRAARRENRLREALQDERRRVSELELEVARQQGEVVKALEKAERRKQRLAALVEDHQAATTRLVEDKSRLEAREREQSEELSRMRQALHGLRMEQEKTRAALYERDEAVMRLKREVALQRARAGGNAGLQPREMAELLGERKEDWQLVYSMKVEELRRAQDVAVDLRQALVKSAADADTRVAAERLAGAERVKAMARERDEAKRELMDLEYKLHEAERRLQELQSSSSAPGPPAPAATACAAIPIKANGAAPSRTTSCAVPGQLPGQQHPQLHSKQQWPSAKVGGGCLSFAAAPGKAAMLSAASGRGRGPTGGDGVGGGEVDDGGDSDLEALALVAMSCPVSEDEVEDGNVGEAGEQAARVRTQAPNSAGKRTAAGVGGDGLLEQRRPPQATAECTEVVAVGSDDNVEEYDNTPYYMGALDAPPPSKRQRQQGAAGGGTRPGGADDGLYDDSNQQFGCDDDAGAVVPVLPRAFSGLFTGGVGAARSLAGAPAGSCSVGRDGLGGGVTAFGPSFAAKVGAPYGEYGTKSGGSLISEGPDGRGGTTRIPLTSSFAHNASKGTLGTKTFASNSRTGRGVSSTRNQCQAVAAAGRIEAFLKPIPQPKRR